jgi:hypothetical protein
MKLLVLHNDGVAIWDIKVFISLVDLQNPCGSGDPDPGPDPLHKTFNFYIFVSNRSKNIPTKVPKPIFNAGVSPASGNQIYLLILVNFHAPEFGSGFAFPIRIQIQDN